MTELTQQGPEQVASTPQPVAASVEPEVVTDADFMEIYNGHRDLPQTPARSESEPTPVAAEPVALPDQQVQQLANQVQTLQAQLANQQTGQSPAQTRQTVQEHLAAKNPGVNRESLNWLVETVETVQSQKTAGLEQRVANLSQGLQTMVNKGVVSDFESQLGGMMDKANIRDPGMRKMVRHTVVNEGLEKHGQNFGAGQSLQTVFHEVNNGLVEQRQRSTDSLIETKEDEAAATPAQHTSQSGRTGVESVQQAIRDPNNRKYDFQGEHMEKLVGRFFDVTDKSVGGALGE